MMRLQTWTFATKVETASGVLVGERVIAHARTLELAEERVRRVNTKRGVTTWRVILEDVRDFCVCFPDYGCQECRTFGKMAVAS